MSKVDAREGIDKYMKQIIKRILIRLVPLRIITWKKSDCSSEIALTFDDGPDPKITPLVLDALKIINAKATFFVIGEKVKRYPEVIKQIVDSGHEIGNHSFSHKSMYKLSIVELENEIRENDKQLSKCKVITGFFRPPYGHIKYYYLPKLVKLKKSIILWSFDSKDYEATNAEEVIDYFKKSKLMGGDILLFHDTAKFTPEIILKIGKIISDKNYKMVTVGDLLSVH